jgi:hypothetical protein
MRGKTSGLGVRKTVALACRDLGVLVLEFVGV